MTVTIVVLLLRGYCCDSHWDDGGSRSLLWCHDDANGGNTHGGDIDGNNSDGDRKGPKVVAKEVVSTIPAAGLETVLDGGCVEALCVSDDVDIC